MLIWVDQNDNPIRTGEKWKTHVEGHRHRAFSILLFNAQGQMLLQQRAAGKYHSPLLWANACCGHPRPSEAVEEAAQRRLSEELGLTVPLTKIGTISYTLKIKDLWENEFTHLFTGLYTGNVSSFSPEEVKACRWISLPNLYLDIDKNKTSYARWFRLYALKLAFQGFFEKAQIVSQEALKT